MALGSLWSPKNPFPLKAAGVYEGSRCEGKVACHEANHIYLVALTALHHPTKKQTLQLLRFTCIR